ncbi:MAG: hypothetical protein IK101_07315 [Oscillospiraceae bacterium]|nr:hypothetical protein [Oscillospiraceae bacterium]
MKKILPIILTILLICAGLTGCGTKQTAPKATATPRPDFFEVITDDRATVFAANYETDKPVCVTYIATENGITTSSSVYDAETIDAVFEALSELTVGDECTSFIVGYEKTFVFTMEDGREYSFSFNIISIEIDGVDRVIFNDNMLWSIDFPTSSGPTLADMLADGDAVVASAIYAAEPTGAEFSYNGGGVSFSADPDVAGRAARIVRTARPEAALTEEQFSMRSSDETPFSLRLIMDDGSQYTFRFAGECMRVDREDGAVFYSCPEAVAEILALGFDGYGELEPALDEAGRKLVGDALISAGEGDALLLIFSDYIPNGTSFIVARDVTVAGTTSAMRIVYNYGAERNYALAEDFTAVSGGRTLDKAELTDELRKAAASLADKQDKNGLRPAQYDFLWRAQFNEAGEIVRLEKTDVD